MPVQINEIVVRATVNSAGNAEREGQSGSCDPPGGDPAGLGASTEEEIAEKVLEILKSKKER